MGVSQILHPGSRQAKSTEDTQPSRDPKRRLLHLEEWLCPWRLLPCDVPPWETVYFWFRRWRADGTCERLNTTLGSQRIHLLKEGTLLQRHSSSGVGDAQDDPLLLAKLDQTLDTHDHPVPEPVLSTDNPGRALSAVFIRQYFCHAGNGFDAVFYTPEPVTRTQFCRSLAG